MNKMKRYGIKEALTEIENGASITYYDFFTLHAGYKLTREGEILGYLTENTADKIIKGYAYRVRNHYSFTVYELAL